MSGRAFPVRRADQGRAVRSQSYLEPHWSDLFLRENLPIDVVISPEIEVGEMILRRLRMPGAFEVLGFCDNEILVLGISCKATAR